MTTTALTSMSGHWTGQLNNAVGTNNVLRFDTLLSPTNQHSQLHRTAVSVPLSLEESSQPAEPSRLGVPSSSRPATPYPSSPSTADELFFDCPQSQSSEVAQDEEMTSTSYMIFQPVVEEDSNIENTDWRRYDPPAELLRSQSEGVSRELKSILAPSIERIQARHIEEHERRASSSRVERPLARTGRASTRPRRQISLTGALDTTHLSPPSRLSATSETSTSSGDSGYVSLSPATDASRSPRSPHRISLGLGALFKRRDRTSGNAEEFDEVLVPRTRRSEAWPLPDTPLAQPPMRQPPVPPAPESSTRECVSCLDDFPAVELIKLTCHSYCNNCFQRLINNALESETHWPAKCCLNPIPSTSIIPHLSNSDAKRYKLRAAEWSIPTSDRIYCSYASCSSWIAPKYINATTHMAKCPKCAHKSCITCRGPHHGNADCPQDPALQATIHLAEMEGWKRCYSCHTMVEHNQGCRHMTCRCKAQFCYICGLKWRTCGCSDAQLNQIQAGVERRRADENERTVRDARARQEEEEEMAAIRAVEEFMRAEEERVVREAEAQRRREEEQRRIREEQRIAVVNGKFRGLNVELESLGDVQRVLMAERYEFETELLKKERQGAIEMLRMRHPTEQQYLFNESSLKIGTAESKFDSEYQVRLAEERRIELQYVDELREYWKGKPDGEYKVRDARDELRRDQDKEYRFWDAYRKQQLEAIRDGERGKMDTLKMKQEAELKAVDGRAKIDEVEWKRKKFAEDRWAMEVGRERVAMLAEMEGREYAEGA